MSSEDFHLDRVAIRMVKEPPLLSEFPINSPEAAIKLMADTVKDYDREIFAIINLRPDLKPINVNFVSVGAVDYALMHPREAIKSMVLSNATSVMMVHNHTTGVAVPSKADISATDRMAKLCAMLGITLLDHVIVGPGKDYYSFREKRAIPLAEIGVATELDEINLKPKQEAEKKKESVKAKLKENKEKVARKPRTTKKKIEKGAEVCV